MTTIYNELVFERYHQLETSPAPEAPVDLATLEEKFHGFVDDVVGHVKHAAEDVLPHIEGAADLATQIAGSTLAQTVLAATLGPADEAWLVSIIQRLDQAAHSAGQALDGDSQDTPTPAPEPEQPQPVPAGPVVGGQAQ